MKKIIIAMAVICAAVFANAANFVWGSAGGEWYDKDGSELYTGTAFLYLGTVTASDTAFDLSGATLLASTGFDDVNWAYGNLDAANPSSSSSLATTTAGQAFSIILVNKSVATLEGFEGNYAIMTGTSEERALPGATVTYYAEMLNSDAPVYTSNTMAAVPEPTSGLLLLLGIAGLALKRKRA
jgi:hypothetical protein